MCTNTTKFAWLLTTRLLNQRYVESRDDHNHRNCVKIHRIKVYGLHFLETVPDKNLIYNINFLTFLQLESENTHKSNNFKYNMKKYMKNMLMYKFWEFFLHHVKSIKSDLLPISKRNNCSWFSRSLLIRQITVAWVCFYIYLHYYLVLNGKRNKYQSIESTDMRNHDFELSILF